MKRYWIRLTLIFISILLASFKYVAGFMAVSQEINEDAHKKESV